MALPGCDSRLESHYRTLRSLARKVTHVIALEGWRVVVHTVGRGIHFHREGGCVPPQDASPSWRFIFFRIRTVDHFPRARVNLLGGVEGVGLVRAVSQVMLNEYSQPLYILFVRR